MRLEVIRGWNLVFTSVIFIVFATYWLSNGDLLSTILWFPVVATIMFLFYFILKKFLSRKLTTHYRRRELDRQFNKTRQLLRR